MNFSPDLRDKHLTAESKGREWVQNKCVGINIDLKHKPLEFLVLT